MCKLYKRGQPGLHFYGMNTSSCGSATKLTSPASSSEPVSSSLMARHSRPTIMHAMKMASNTLSPPPRGPHTQLQGGQINRIFSQSCALLYQKFELPILPFGTSRSRLCTVPAAALFWPCDRCSMQAEDMLCPNEGFRPAGKPWWGARYLGL